MRQQGNEKRERGNVGPRVWAGSRFTFLFSLFSFPLVAGCREAFTTDVAVQARAGDSELSVDRMAEIFAQGKALWRLSVPQTTEPIATPHEQLIEWGGGLRWVSGELDALTIRSTVDRLGGHATLFRNGDKSIGVFHPLNAPLMKIHRRLKDAFDPAGIFNPGRMYSF